MGLPFLTFFLDVRVPLPYGMAKVNQFRFLCNKKMVV